MYLNIICQVVGGLGLFLFGMNNMSKGMQVITGRNFKKALSTLTTNRLLAIGVGIVLTALIQSSSVSTVMTIGFVNASLLTLKQALGVILGANIGTTITGWLLALNLGKYGLPIVGVGAICYMFSEKEKTKQKFMTLMGFGFIFLGLETMSKGLSPIRDMPVFIELFKAFSADTYFGMIKAVLVGMMITAVVQSSAATLGITITLATQGLISYPTAVALVLGENVGTTVTALLASIGAQANAKRAAIAHTLINIIGIIWATSIFNYYILFLDQITGGEKGNLGVAIAMAHTVFNVSNVIFITPFIGYLASFLQRVIKDDVSKKENVTKLNHLMMKLPDTAVYQTKTEVNNMADALRRSFSRLEECILDAQLIEKYLPEISEIEEKLDMYEKEIYDYNFELLNKEISPDQVYEIRSSLLVCDEYETVSDYLGRIANRFSMLVENEIEIDEARKEDILKLHNEVMTLYNEVHLAFQTDNKILFSQSIKRYSSIKTVFKTARKAHFDNSDQVPSRLNTGYLDIINFYRRMADHLYNIVEYYMKL